MQRNIASVGDSHAVTEAGALGGSHHAGRFLAVIGQSIVARRRTAGDQLLDGHAGIRAAFDIFLAGGHDWDGGSGDRACARYNGHRVVYAGFGAGERSDLVGARLAGRQGTGYDDHIGHARDIV